MRYAASRLDRPTPDDPSTCRRSLTHQRLASPKCAQLRSLSIQFSASGFGCVGFAQFEWHAECFTMMRCNHSIISREHLERSQHSRGRPALEVIGEFTTCAAKSYWIALVLTGDEDTAARIISSRIHGVADSGKVFGEWMCAWGIDVVIKACVALHTDELRKEEGSREYWRAKAAEGPTIELQQAPVSTEGVRRALLLLPLFPRFVYVLRVLEGYSLSYVASSLNVDEEACQAALAYSFGALAEALMPVQLARQQ